MRPVTVVKSVELELGFIVLSEDQYVQVHAGDHVVEVQLKWNGEVVVCVDDTSIVSTFDEVYVPGYPS